MKKELTDLDISTQLGNPSGEIGKQIAEEMNENNRETTINTYRQMHVEPTGKVLEVGFGNGKLMPLFFDYHPNASLYGIDHSKQMVDEAKRYMSNSNKAKQISLFEAGVEQLPFEKGFFNSVCAINTFYFWNDVKKGLLEIYRVLEDGGYFYLSLFPKSEIGELPPSKYFNNLLEIDEIEKILLDTGFYSLKLMRMEEPPIKIGKQPKVFTSALFKVKK